ncbi:uncharacterized protein LOC129775494 [Toxorhynchites rutilus septentrionalis]|uniref:uncharacterized protein LOC129775494 n=1 Tax=Toxorhynchites rutilus septentrionalis TaxID=329112 RepID=UPI00247ACFA1|nr:uncharacterized protein LOC129775494 [Toxorhynchites rutilus septentrionalis]
MIIVHSSGKWDKNNDVYTTHFHHCFWLCLCHCWARISLHPQKPRTDKMSYTSRNFVPFFLFRSVTTGSLSDGAVSGSRQLEQQMLFPTMTEDDRDISIISFEKINTTPILWFQLVCSMALTAVGLAYCYYGCYSGNECAGYYTMLKLRAGFWFVTFIIHLLVKSKHNRMKILGYHTFLRETHRYKKTSLQVVSLVNLVILTAHTALLHMFGSHFFIDCALKGFSTTLSVSAVCLLECIVLVLIHIPYFVKTKVFNVIQNPPDALLQRGNGQTEMSPEEFINQQFLLIVKLMDENRHMHDKIREARASAHLINSESTQLSIADQSFVIGY